MEEKIIETLEKIRPFLNNHGGDVEFVKYEDNIVYVKLTGVCSNCMHANDTLTNIVQSSLEFEIPEIKKVVNVDGSY